MERKLVHISNSHYFENRNRNRVYSIFGNPLCCCRAVAICMRPIVSWPLRRTGGWEPVNLEEDFDISDLGMSEEEDFVAPVKVKKSRGGRWRSKHSQFAQYSSCQPNKKYKHSYRAEDEQTRDIAIGRQRPKKQKDRRLRLNTVVDVFVYLPVDEEGPIVTRRQIQSNRQVLKTLKQAVGNSWMMLDEGTTDTILRKHANATQFNPTPPSTATPTSETQFHHLKNTQHYQKATNTPAFAGLSLAGNDALKSISSQIDSFKNRADSTSSLHFRWNVLVS